MLVRKDSALGWARMSLLALALVVLMAQLVSTPASAQPVAPVTPEQPPVGVAPEEPAGQQYGPASEEKSPVDSAVEEDETPSPEGSVISIRCAPGYELVEGEDPSGREDACIPEDGKDAVSEDAQADKLPEEIAPAKEDASGEGAATAAGVPRPRTGRATIRRFTVAREATCTTKVTTCASPMSSVSSIRCLATGRWSIARGR